MTLADETPNPTLPCLLVIDAQQRMRRSMSRLLTSQGFRVRAVGSGREGVEVASDDSVAVVLADVALPDMTGEALIRAIISTSPGTICIAMTDDGSAESAASLLDCGARDYFEKPITDWGRFNRAIHQQLEVWKRGKELQDLRDQVQEMTRNKEEHALIDLKGNSAAIQQVLAEIRIVGPLPVPVLIRGESGTGKELVAEALHNSCTPDGPFVPVNCAAIPHDLFESELFGHEKGAFTSAEHRIGLCESAAGGTLFLDEVGEMPLELQAKLLRVLEQRRYRRVGADGHLPLEARVIAATNTDLEEAIRAKKFRDDLYFRLSSQEIWVPPLRERREDIKQLVYHFVDKYNQAFSRSIQRVHPDALRCLEEHDWVHNNVRELDREIQRALARCTQQEELTPDLLFTTRRHLGAASDPGQTPDVFEGLLDLPYKQAIKMGRDRIARWYLTHFLDRAGWNRTVAAEATQMERTNLLRLIRELGIKSDSED